ncbi:MAG TPA: ABC transporter permease [Cyclobacteriaceae bacterium]|nr:ABC transporter permease [Cyclobacteriaceae bacterium]
MIRNYIKIAFRALFRSKVHSAINIIGLSLGIGCCILITLFVKDEWTFDRFHTNADRIYRVYAREDWGENQQFFYTNTPFPMGPALKDNIPEVESQIRINKMGALVRIGDDIFSETINIVDRDFFKVFDFEMIQGTGDVLDKANNIVISEFKAKQFFGNSDPIGKVISVQLGETFEEFTVAAVSKRVPTNSSIGFYLMISDLNYPKLYDTKRLTESWFNISPETYVMLRPDVDPKVVEGKFPALFKTLLGEERFNESKYAPGLQPLTSIHLDTSFPVGLAPVSDPKYSLILAAIALLILFVACINFVTLSIGRSMKRAKEVGIRKVVGAARKQLITQFIGEAILITTISMVIGVAMAVLSLPTFNNLAGKELVFPIDRFLATLIVSLLLIIGLISGSYPAFVLSAFRPVAILKGSVQSGGSKQVLRKVLVGVQLVLSIFLITCTLVMRNQLGFLQNKNLGFNKEQLVVVPMNFPRGPRMAELVKQGFERTELFKTALAGKPGIAATCAASHDFGNGGWVNVGYTDDKSVYRTFDINAVDDEYIPVMGMEMALGRNFNDANTSDIRRAVIVNEAFVREYGWSDPIGKKIPGKNFLDHEVVGVIKDFNYTSLYTKVPSLVIVQNVEIIAAGIENIGVDQRPVPKLIVRLKAGETAAGLDQIKSAWETISGEEEFRFSFVDQSLEEQYRADQNLGKIVSVATVLAILIGSLGLYGLASLAMQNRTKEITIRKVLGATEGSLLVLLSREYIILITVCLLISVPLTMYLMQGWLDSFEYRVNIGWVVFLISGGISLTIAMLTIGHQTLKTAWTQPAEALKYE